MGPMLFAAMLVALAVGGAYMSGFRIARAEDIRPEESPSLGEVEQSDPEKLPTIVSDDPVQETIDAAEVVFDVALANGCTPEMLKNVRERFEKHVQTNPMFAFIAARAKLDQCITGSSEVLDGAPPPPPIFDAQSPGLPPFPGQQSPQEIKDPGEALREGAVMVTRATMICGPTVVEGLLARQQEFIDTINQGIDPLVALATLQQHVMSLCPQALQSQQPQLGTP